MKHKKTQSSVTCDMKSKISSVILITADDTQLEEIAVTHCQNQEEPKCSEFTRTHTHAIQYYKLLRSSLDCNPHVMSFLHTLLYSHLWTGAGEPGSGCLTSLSQGFSSQDITRMNQIKLKETDRHWTCGRAPGLKSKRSSFARGPELKGTDCIFACVCLTCVSVFAHVKRRHAGSPACYLACVGTVCRGCLSQRAG